MLPHGFATLVRDHRAAFPIVLVGNQIADLVRIRGELDPVCDGAQMDKFCALAVPAIALFACG
jgi:hypothetical protein